jgi:hypothetical protein
MTRAGGYECVDVSRSNLLEFRDTLNDQVVVQPTKHGFHLGQLFA